MANKRMLCKQITESDAFLDMPMSAQCLYFHLVMNADDDGFIGGVKRMIRTLGAADDDFKILVGKRFLLDFGNGVIVIKHWRIHNTITQNRYHETVYLDEKATLYLKDDKSYSLTEGTPLLECGSQTACKRLTSGSQTADSDLGLGLDLDLEKKKSIKEKEACSRQDCQEVVEAYNNICKSLSRVEKISQAREKAIKARLKSFTKAQIRHAFALAESSRFLCGNNDKNWKADFDWIIGTKNGGDQHLTRILEGSYINRYSQEKPRAGDFSNFEQRQDDLDAMVVGRYKHGT